MEIILADEAAVDAFLADDNAEVGVKNAVAETAGVSADAVTVVLSKRERVPTTTTTTTAAASRRLQGSPSSTRRLQETTEYYVHVDSTIAVADQDAADALAADVGDVDTAAFATTLTDQLTAAGVATTAFAGLEVGTVSTPTTAAIPSPSPPVPSGTANGAIMTCQTSNLAALFTASAWLASFSCLP